MSKLFKKDVLKQFYNKGFLDDKKLIIALTKRKYGKVIKSRYKKVSGLYRIIKKVTGEEARAEGWGGEYWRRDGTVWETALFCQDAWLAITADRVMAWQDLVYTDMRKKGWKYKHEKWYKLVRKRLCQFDERYRLKT